MRLFGRKKSTQDEPPAISRPRAQGHLPTPPAPAPKPASTRRSLGSTQTTPLYARFARADSFENLSLRARPDSRAPSYAPTQQELEQDAQRLGYDRPWAQELMSALDTDPEPSIRVVSNPKPVPDKRMSLDAVAATDPFMASKMQSVMRRAPSNVRTPEPPKRSVTAPVAGPAPNPPPPRIPTAPPTRAVSRSAPKPSFDDDESASRQLPSTAKRERGPPPVAGTPSAYAWKSGQSDDGHGGSNFYTGGSQANPFPPPTAPSSFTLPPGAAPPDPYGTSAPGPSVLKKRTPSNPPTNRTPAPHTRRMSVDGGNARPLSGGPGTWGGSAIAVPSTGPGRERERDTTGPNPAGPNLNGPNSYVASPTTTYADLSRAPTVRSVQPGEIFHHPGAPLPLPASQQAPYQAVTPPPPPAKSPVTVGRGAKPVPQRQVTSPQPVSPQPIPQPNQIPQANQLPQAPQPNKAIPPPQPTQPPQQRPTPITTTSTSTKKHTLPPGAAPAEPAKHSPGSYSPGYSAYGPTPGSAYGSYGVNGESPVRKVDGESPVRKQDGESSVRKQDGESSVRKQDGGKASQVASQVSDARATQASDARTLDARTTSQVSASQVSDTRTTQVSDTRASQASDFRKSQASDVRTIQAEPRPSQFGEPTRPAPSQFTEPTKPVPNQFTEPTKPVPNQFTQGLKPVPSPVGKSESTWSRSVAAESTRSVESRSVVIESTPGRAIEATRPVAEPTRPAKLEPTRPVAEPARSVAEPTRSTATESTRSATLEPTRPSLEPTGRTSTHGDPRSSTYSRASSVSVVPPSTPVPPSPTKSRSTSSPVRNLPPRPGPSPLPHSSLQSGAVPSGSMHSGPPSSMHSIPPRAPSSMSVSSYGTALPLESEPGSEPPSKLALGGLAPINTTTRSGSPTPTVSSSAMVTARMTPTTSAALSPQHLGVPRSVSPTPTTSTRADDSDTESAVKKRNLLVKTRKMDGASSFRTSEERPVSVAQPQSPGPGLGLSGGEDPFARSPPTIVKSTKRVVEPAPKRAMPLSPPLSSDDHDTQGFPAVDQQDDRSPMTPALTDEADAEPESTTPPGSPPLPKIYPLETHMNMPSLLAALLPHISFRDWNALNALNAGVRRQLEETRALREEVLEYWLRGVGYARWKSHKRELLTLTLRDLNAYMRGVSIAVYRYSAIAESFLAVRAQQEQTKERVPGAASKGNLVRALASSCRAYTKVILRLREQADFMPGEDFRSPLFKSGNAPLLRVFVPSKEGAWLSDTSVLDCEKELKRAGALGVLRVGDVVWDTAVGDEGNAGRMVWDGNYLVDLDYTYSTTGELPKYIHSLAFSPSYWHKIIRTSNSPLCHIDLTPYAAEIAANLHLVQDRVQTETPQGGRHTVVRWVHRSRFQIRTGLPIPGASPPALVDRMWEGYMVVEVEGTNEGLADLQTRVGNAVRLFPTKTAGMELGPPTGKSPFRLLRSASRPGEIWIRAVREKERLI